MGCGEFGSGGCKWYFGNVMDTEFLRGVYTLSLSTWDVSLIVYRNIPCGGREGVDSGRCKCYFKDVIRYGITHSHVFFAH